MGHSEERGTDPCGASRFWWVFIFAASAISAPGISCVALDGGVDKAAVVCWGVKESIC